MKALNVPIHDRPVGLVALHVEWTDCPTCDGWRKVPVQFDVYQIAWEPCPTCKPTVEGDGPIVEVE